MDYLDEDDLRTIRFTEKTSEMIDRAVEAAAEYAMSQNSSITRDGLPTELCELIDAIPYAFAREEAFNRISRLMCGEEEQPAKFTAYSADGPF